MKYKNNILKIITSFFVLTMVCFVVGHIYGSFQNEMLLAEHNTTSAGELIPGNQYVQTFISKDNVLTALEISMATYGRSNTGVIEISLKESDSQQVLRSEKISMQDMQDNTYMRFRFKPVLKAKNKEYEIYIRVLSGQPGNTVTIWLDENNPYLDGSYILNGKTTNNDMLVNVMSMSYKRIGFIIMLAIMVLVILLICIKHKQRTIALYNCACRYIHSYRYLIGIVILLTLSLLKVHGSSIGLWESYMPDKYTKENEQKIIGRSRGIRSDEWLVQTPWYLGQAGEDVNFDLYNPNIGLEGQNMSLIAPTKNIVNFVKLPNWGFLIGREFGFSWWWVSRAILLLLLTVELSLILTKDNKKLSWLAGIWILLSPPIQWWYSTGLPDIILYGMLMMVCANKYIVALIKEEDKRRYIYGIGLVIGALGLGSTVYPPFQIPMIVIIISFIMAQIFEYKKLILVNIKKDLLYIGMLFIVLVAIYLKFVWDARDVISLASRTIYPGKRAVVGGYLPFINMDWYLTNWLLPFKDVTFSNNSEASQFISFWQITIVAYVLNYKDITDKVTHMWFITLMLFMGWMVLPISNVYGKLLFFNFVQAERINMFVGLLSILLLISIVSQHTKEKNSKKINIILLIGIGIYIINNLYHNYLSEYLGASQYIIVTVSFAVYVAYLVFNKHTNHLIINIIAVSILSGMMVNPIVFGLDSIYNKELAYAIQEIEKNDPEGVWVTADCNINGNYLVALGIKVINPVQYVPQFSMWEKLDESGQYSDIYNRYAHIRVNLTEEQTSFELIGADVYGLNLNYEDLIKLDTDYILTSNMISEQLQNRTELLYENNFKIYKVIE